MRRINGPPEVIGMPFLDLICCAFGGVILLFILSDRVDGTRKPAVEGMQLIVAETMGSAPHKVGLRLQVNGDKFECWPGFECHNSKVIWDLDRGTTTGAIKGGGIEGTVEVAVVMLEDPSVLPESICIRLSILGGNLDYLAILQRKDGYRIEVPVNAKSRVCS